MLLSAHTVAARIGVIIAVSGGLAVVRSQQPTKSLDTDDLTLVPLMLRFDDPIEALVNPLMMIVLEILRVSFRTFCLGDLDVG